MTDESLLQSKSQKHLLESFDQRSRSVRDFLTFIKPQITSEVIRIMDLFGPTDSDPNIQALIVSKETSNGVDPSTLSYLSSLSLCSFFLVVRRRAENHLPPLHAFIVDVISATSASLAHDDMAWLKENKLSSTTIREWIAKRDNQKEDKNST